jgi:enoyl-CoA hydratase
MLKRALVSDAYKEDYLESWTKISNVRKPVIAAVSGYAVRTSPLSVALHTRLTIVQLGGGFELAQMCDIILAAPSATFGQPEINLGVIPGGGGTQRLTHAIGKSRAMELVLTGKMFGAQDALAWGLVARVVPEGEGVVVKEAVELAKTIASKPRLAVIAGKEAVNASFELSLAEGLRLERRLFHGVFSTADKKEGEQRLP